MDLSRIDLFRDFTPEDRQQFAAAVQPLDLAPGQILFEENDPGDALYIVESGAVRIFKHLDRSVGTEKSLALLESGAYLGEMTILDGTPRSASARAESPSRILKISRNDLLSLLRTHPNAALRLFLSFMKVMSQRLRQTGDELVVLFDIGRLIGDAPPLDDLLRGLLTRTMAGASASLGAVFFLNDITNRLEVRDAEGPDSVNLLQVRTPINQGVVAHAIASNRILRIDDLPTSEFASLPRFGHERNRMLIAPLIRAEKPFGALFLADPSHGRPFDNANVNLISAVASQAAAAVESALRHQSDAAKAELDRHYFQF